MAIHRPCGTFDRTYYEAKAIFRTRLQWGMITALILALYGIAFVMNDYLLGLSIVIFSFIVAMLGIQIITGYAGQITIGHAAFVGVGMYVLACVEAHLGWSWWVGMPLAGIGAGLISMFFGSPSGRLKELYLAFATLAAHFIIVYVISNWESMTGGVDGIWLSRPEPLLGIDFMVEHNYYLLALTLCIAMIYLAKNLARTKLGRAFVAVRDNDIAAEVMGINIFSTKLLAFGIGGFFAGIGGAMYAGYNEYVNVEFFPLMDSIWFLGFLVVGGFGSIFGAICAAVLWKCLDEMATLMTPVFSQILPGLAFYVTASFSLIMYTLIIVIFLVLEPRGINHRWNIIKASYRLHPFAY